MSGSGEREKKKVLTVNGKNSIVSLTLKVYACVNQANLVLLKTTSNRVSETLTLFIRFFLKLERK